MKKPEWPLGMLIKEGDVGPYCPKCESSLKYKFWPFIKSDKCIQPKCDNYYDWISVVIRKDKNEHRNNRNKTKR